MLEVGALWGARAPLFSSQPAMKANAHAVAIGQRARGILAAGPARGAVLAALTDVVYLDADGELVWLGRQGLPLHRRAILAPVAADSFTPGVGFSASERGLQFGDGRTVELAAARTWVPPMPSSGEPLATVGERAEAVRALVCREKAPRGGLGLEIGLDVACVLAGARSLVGLGPGLTPAGDDYVGGVLFAAFHLASHFPHAVGWPEAPVAEFLKEASSLTVRISHALLSDLAQGHGPAPLHELMVGILEAWPLGSCVEAAARVRGMGQSTGRALLAGVLTAAAAAARGASDSRGAIQKEGCCVRG